VPVDIPNPGVTYADARDWFAYLGMFTVGDLADAWGVHDDVAAWAVRAGLHQRPYPVLYDTGDSLNGDHRGVQGLWGYVPLPAGPREHPRRVPPELWRSIGVYADAPRHRGWPVPGTSSHGTARARRRSRSVVG
jgi:hypothetical protein